MTLMNMVLVVSWFIPQWNSKFPREFFCNFYHKHYVELALICACYKCDFSPIKLTHCTTDIKCSYFGIFRYYLCTFTAKFSTFPWKILCFFVHVDTTCYKCDYFTIKIAQFMTLLNILIF